jgi:hypothetical protein
LISEGQLNNILIHRKESFHEEKDELQLAGIKATAHKAEVSGRNLI